MSEPMARVLFKRDYDYTVKPTVTVAYKAGMDLSVPKAHADAAVAAGAAELIPQPASPAVVVEAKTAG